METKVGELITQQAVKSAVGTEHSRGTHKGADFEDAVHSSLAALCRQHQDELERTGNDNGLNGRSKRGDFVIEVNPRDARGRGLRLVLEAKNDQSKRRELLRELDQAMENRGAQFAIGISTNPALLPVGAPPIDFCSESKILIHVGDFDAETGEFDPIFLVVAVNIARYLSIITRGAQSHDMDIGKLNEHVTFAINTLTRFSELKRQLTSIANTANESHTLVEAIRKEVLDSLQAIRDAIEDGLGVDEARPKGQLKSA